MGIEFLATSIAVILLPGIGVLYCIAIGLGRGFNASLMAAIGCTLGIVPAAIASIIGLAAIFHTSALAFQVVKYLGVLYMLYMAWNIVRDGGALDIKEEKNKDSMIRIAIRGTLINILNPKLSLFFLAFLPQFVDAGHEQATQAMVMLAGVFMLLTFIVFTGYGLCASLAHEYVVRRPRVLKWLKRSFAATFGFLGVRLALSER
ncbi:LysE family translocator [Pseudemcibacter aquimaris]|uniref:LysE family translocator n=1 Tax=Pseudemcibacter aquimaris TaxID=2857064 RepID=UPI00201286A8|nr:LysE family translocator [Pseudemcibacter aquimaris]MCC3859940.1 LysE family translocator [Pseudemcibacter aquimaris]WDU57272.1 LysE family translocator [Pseudemcibacter aquimaris]